MVKWQKPRCRTQPFFAGISLPWADIALIAIEALILFGIYLHAKSSHRAYLWGKVIAVVNALRAIMNFLGRGFSYVRGLWSAPETKSSTPEVTDDDTDSRHDRAEHQPATVLPPGDSNAHYEARPRRHRAGCRPAVVLPPGDVDCRRDGELNRRSDYDLYETTRYTDSAPTATQQGRRDRGGYDLVEDSWQEGSGGRKRVYYDPTMTGYPSDRQVPYPTMTGYPSDRQVPYPMTGYPDDRQEPYLMTGYQGDRQEPYSTMNGYQGDRQVPMTHRPFPQDDRSYMQMTSGRQTVPMMGRYPDGGNPYDTYTDHRQPMQWPSSHSTGRQLGGEPSHYVDHRHAVPTPHPNAGYIDNSRRREKEPMKFSGKTDFDEYMGHFYAIAHWNRWDYADSGMQLACSLIEGARGILATVPPSLSYDFDTLESALKRKYSPPGKESQYAVEFMNRICRPNESVAEYGHALQYLAIRAYPGSTIAEPVMIDLFIKGLPDLPLKRHVHSTRPATLSEAITTAVSYQAFDRCQVMPPPYKPHPVKQVAQVASVAPPSGQNSTNMTVQAGLNSYGNNRPRPVRPRRDLSTIECFRCHQMGHYSRDCPSNMHAPRPRAEPAQQIQGPRHNPNIAPLNA